MPDPKSKKKTVAKPAPKAVAKKAVKATPAKAVVKAKPAAKAPAKPAAKPVKAAAKPDAYNITTYTHIYDGAYGSPEVDQSTPRVTEAVPSADGLSVVVRLDKITEDHSHDFDLAKIIAQDGQPLLHKKAYYTVNEIPKN